ncbi:serine protease FAM111A-like [Hemibagrus wyckioides]|nr:serine protease FAM111A-like [Hemibagrus wyckioides]XP_058230491.1 serine protease FAM111A-like [Hemibagrus wyckioides]
MDKCYKTEGEESGPDTDTTAIKRENHGHTFRFQYERERYTVTCNALMTILQRLQRDPTIKSICNKNQNKEMVIRREQMPRAAVTPHFPCCLLKSDELLDIKFIKPGGNSDPGKTPKLAVHSAENLMCFYVQTRGGKNIRKVMKSNELKSTVDSVCVYAVKGEKVKVALKRDGRFNSVIFRKGALYEWETKSTMNLSNLVDDMDGKHFQITVSPHPTGSQESSQEMSQEPEETVKDENSAAPETPQEEKPNPNSTNAQVKKTETPQEEKMWRIYPNTKEIPNTGEILSLLREQHGQLLKTLQERQNVKKFFREEYDKSIQSFSEVKKVKELMGLSDSVCQLCFKSSAVGTGFLLFDKFVLTNAHVVEDLRNELTAVFHLEDMSSVRNVIPVEENVVAFRRGKDEMGNYLDFALLELSDDPKVPELLERYSAPPSRGAVCIIGHPGGGVKQMDPCFIIAKDDIPQAFDRYFKENQSLPIFHVIKHQYWAEDKEIRKSQINYHSCFFHGSSGSPLFDHHCNLIGVHTGGYTYEGERNRTRSVMEYSLPLLPILVHIFIQCSSKKRKDSSNSVHDKVVQYFESQKNLKYVVNIAKEQLERNPQPMDTS